MKRKAISRILAISLSVAMCAQSIPIYAAEEIGTSAAADFFAEDSIENQSLNEGDAETNTETNMKADATTGISEAYTLEESNSATTSEETVTDEDGFWSGESETVESSANGSDGWESAEMDGAEAGDEAVKRDAAAFVSGDVEENVEETGETNELEEALSESAEMTEGDFSYVIVNNSYARITRYSGSATIVQVPSTIGGYAVQVIGARAFQGNTVLESVELPDGLTTIYAYAFEKCTGITSIHLPDSITTMGYKVFGGCSNLVSANYPVNWVNSPSGNGSNSYEYGNVFSGCPKLTEIEIPEGVKAIAPHSFANLTTLTRVTLPSSLTEIGRYAFAGAIGLTEVMIPENTQIIRDHAFADCTNLTQINLSEGLTTIYAYAFENCTGITSIHLPDSITTLGYKVFGSCSNLVSANYPVNWVNSPSGNGSNSYEYGNVFSGCPKLTEMEIPEGVKVIAPHSFANLTTLTSVTLPSSLTEIGNHAFAGATGLTEVTIPENTQIIRNHAFADCTNLTQINLSEGLTTIYAYAFENCTGITNIHLPDSITTMGYKVFGGCSNLESANYPVNWVNSPSGNGSNSYEYGNVFSGCPKLTEMEIPEGVKVIAPHSFANLTTLTSVTLPSSLTEIGNHAFAGATGLTEVTIPENTQIIRNHAFADCTNLTQINLSEGLTTIYAYAFVNCTGITSIHLPDSITTMGYKVFGGCSNLESANYPVNWVNSPSGNGSNSYEYGNVFSGCPKLTEMEIPEGVKVIAPHSFANLTTLTSVTLPSSLTEIGNHAFAGATGLTEVTIPENTQIIRNHAFADCTNLTQINLSEGLTTIYAYAFVNCTGITSIHLPDSITTMGYKVFGGCSNLESANYPVNWVNSPSGNGSNSYEYGNVFSGCPKLTGIEIPEGVKVIAPHSFASLTTLTSVTLPSSLTEIGAYAFAGATGLTEVTLPSNTKTIRDYAFADCAGLKDIYIPDSTTDIRKAVFENCPQLTIHCSYYSMATIYAIENNIPFEQIGTYTDSAETVLDRSDTSYYGDFGSATANGYVAMTVRYNIKDTWKSAVSDLNVKLVLPSNGELDESTLKVDGELCQNYNLKDRTLTIPVSGTSGIIRFSIKAQSQSAARSYAILNYKKNRNSSQEIIGVLNESINLFTIDAPDVVSKPTVNVSGMANAGGTVTLLVNEKEQQTVQVSKAGLWSAVLTLENPSNYETYKIKALCTQADGTTETRTAAVTYNEGEPSIESFKMYYNEHDKIKSYDLTKTDGVTPLVYYLPKSKFDYELTFENRNR